VAVHEEEAQAPEPRDSASNKQRRIVGGAFVVMMAGRIVGAAISPIFLAHAPLGLLVLSPVIGHLVVVAALAEPIPYFSIAVLVSILHCGLGFVLGDLLGPRLVDFLVRKNLASEAKLQRLLTPLRLSAPLLVFLIPGPIVCALAGASAASRRSFIPAMIASQIVWVELCRRLGQSLLGGIATMRAELARNVIPVTVATVLIVIFVRFVRLRRSR
jgi:membrane protein DedA with SNARE-associated domain